MFSEEVSFHLLTLCASVGLVFKHTYALWILLEMMTWLYIKILWDGL